MATKETNRDRQTEEFEVIKSIFGTDVEDLRPKNTSWKPLDIRILLTPLKGSSGEDLVYVTTKLHITCSHKYPKVSPKIFLEETKGISDTLIEELLQQLQQQALGLKGEVMIFDLAHTVQTFLHKHNKPPKGSFYEEMLQEREKREQEQMTIQLQKQTLERQNLLEEVEKRKEIFKSEAKRREPRRSISETNNSNRRQNTSSESSENSSAYYLGSTHIYPHKCLEHKGSETLYFHKNGRQIKRGCCLGHSQKGCVVYSGIDLDSGQLFYMTEWIIKYSQVESKCIGNCYWLGDTKCNGHKIDELINSIEKHVAYLSQLHHKNLIQYECVLCLKRKEGIVIYLVQDFVLGTSLLSISATLGWCTEGSRMVAKGILDALNYLHNNGISHSYLLDSTVFMDNCGVIRCADFSLVPHLLELVTGIKPNHGDLPALGSLIESLMPTLPYEMRDFVDKCNSNRTLSASELNDHPFLRKTLQLEFKKEYKTDIDQQVVQNLKKVTLAVPQTTSVPFSVSNCRLRTEFEVLKYLGKGAFGDVLKARNILDNREYAVKRIPLLGRNQKLFKKMTREVELLSRLNHENVVRYFNSWIENCTPAELEEMDSKLSDDDGSISPESLKPLSPCPPAIASDVDSSSDMWKCTIEDSDTDDGIQFVDSNGEEVVYDDENENLSDDTNRKSNSPRQLLQVMYIQMEFCEKCTLRLAIDDNLYQNNERLWRYFREIAEGLSHIHQQGIIHRDLKPVNIFLDSRDQIKIGDFGLATTSFLALQANEQQTVNSTLRDDAIGTGTGTGTGKVGTTLYVAPELTGNASKSIYNQKVDMYTLGIILFEMSNPPFETGMERIKTILSLRNSTINIPENMLSPQYENTVKIIRWLLNHDATQRPTAEELLASELVPPAQLEASELQEMLRHVLANPQSKSYKHLVARCLQQECNEVVELTYHMGLVHINRALEFVKSKVLNLFRKHGGIEVNTPLLNPLSKHTYNNNSSVRLMTHSGAVVILPNDLRVLFAKHIATSGTTMLRRFSVDRVYREKKIFNFHPKQSHQCSFDIITPNPGNQLVDAELISMAYEITAEIPKLKEKNISIRINHTSLLRAILLFCSVPKSEYRELFENYMDFIEGRITKFQFQSAVTLILENSKSSATMLIDLMLTDVQIGGQRSFSDGSALKSVIRGKGEATSLAKGAIRELELTVQLAQSLGVTCPIHLCAGLPISYDSASSGGIVWQMITNIRLNRSIRPTVLAYGERYDTMLLEFRKQVQSSNANAPICGVSGAGFSFNLEKLLLAVGTEFDEDRRRSIDVVVCVTGCRPPMKDVTYILRLLWSAGIRTGVVEANVPEEAKEYAKELGAVHVILLGECGELRVRSWDNERFQEHHVTRTELVGYIQKLLTTDTINLHSDWHSGGSGYSGSGGGGSQSSSYTQGSSTSNAISIRNNFINHMPNIEVRFLTHDKMTANMRKRCENQVTQQMQSTLMQFGRKEHFIVMVVDLTSSIINAIIGAINPRQISQKETEKEISYIIERFPKQKRYISEIIDDIFEELAVQKNKPVMALYSIGDSCFRIII